MIDFKQYMPSEANTPFVAKTKYGVRIVAYNSSMQFFRYEDCTHPMQNCYCNPFDIEEWEYCDKSKMDDLLFTKSWVGAYIRQKEADSILNTIKVSKLDVALYRVKAFWHHIINRIK